MTLGPFSKDYLSWDNNMRIGIDITPLQNGHRQRGVGTYARQLLTGLAKVDKTNNYLLFGYPGIKPEVPSDNRFTLIQSGPSRKNNLWTKFKWHQLTLPSLVRRYNVDLVHLLVQSAEFNLPIQKSARTVVTVHDLKGMLFPDFFLNDFRKRASYNLMINISKRANHIITDSNSSKRDIIKMLPSSPNKITVVPLAADPAFYKTVNKDNTADTITVLKKYNLETGYILFVGAIEPSKNIQALLEAYQRLDHYQQLPELVLVGIKDPNYFFNLRYKYEHLFSTSVRCLDFVPAEDLPALYRAARLFVYPSLYEGFGLPVLEAMASGTPVITSNTSSLPEMAGNGAVLVDASDPSLLSIHIHKLLNNADARRKLTAKGLAQARNFSWERCARQTLAVYNLVVKGDYKNQRNGEKIR